MEVSLLTYNIANAVFEEKAMEGAYRFGKRFGAILENLLLWKKKYKLNVIAIQEIRGCKSEDGQTSLTTTEIAERIGSSLGMKYTLQGNTKDPLWIHKALYYDPLLFTLDFEDTLWIKRTAREDEWINAHGTYLRSAAKGGRDYRFAFWNCHPNPDLQTRLEYCQAFGQHLTNQKKSNCVHIAMGDFNTLQQDAQSQYALMKNHFTFLTDEVKQTFHGFPYDTDKEGVVWQGKLDHVLVANTSADRVGLQKACALPEKELSDHWPLFCNLLIKQKG